MEEWVNEWMDGGWMNGWRSGRMEGWILECVVATRQSTHGNHWSCHTLVMSPVLEMHCVIIII